MHKVFADKVTGSTASKPTISATEQVDEMDLDLPEPNCSSEALDATSQVADLGLDPMDLDTPGPDCTSEALNASFNLADRGDPMDLDPDLPVDLPVCRCGGRKASPSLVDVYLETKDIQKEFVLFTKDRDRFSTQEHPDLSYSERYAQLKLIRSPDGNHLPLTPERYGATVGDITGQQIRVADLCISTVRANLEITGA